MKKFYIETFGCQMNAHDSEKVIGTLLSNGYEQVETPEAADLVFHLLVLLRGADLTLADVVGELARRHAAA